MACFFTLFAIPHSLIFVSNSTRCLGSDTKPALHRSPFPHACTPMSTHIYLNTRTHARIHARTYASMHTRSYTYTPPVYTPTTTHTHSDISKTTCLGCIEQPTRQRCSIFPSSEALLPAMQQTPSLPTRLPPIPKTPRTRWLTALPPRFPTSIGMHNPSGPHRQQKCPRETRSSPCSRACNSR